MRVLSVYLTAVLSVAHGLAGAETKRVTTARPIKLEWPAAKSPPFRFVQGIGGRDPWRLVRPYGMAIAADGRIFVADPGNRGIVVYDRRTGSAVRWTGNAQFPLDGASGVALAEDGRVFVTDVYRSQVVVFDSSGQPVGIFGREVLKRPQSIAIDSHRGRIFIGDVRLHQVFSFDSRTLKLEKPIGAPAGNTGRPQFSSPASLAVNSMGRLYVADMWNCSVQIFGPDGMFLRRFATQCERAGKYGRPRPIAVDRQDRVYVADPDDQSLQMFHADGKPLELIAGLAGPRGSKPFARTAIAVDREGQIFVLEQGTGEGRVHVFACASGDSPQISRRARQP